MSKYDLNAVRARVIQKRAGTVSAPPPQARPTPPVDPDVVALQAMLDEAFAEADEDAKKQKERYSKMGLGEILAEIRSDRTGS